MKDFYILDNLEAEIDEAVVMKLMDCQKDTPARKEMEAEYWQLCGKAGTLVKPVGILGFGTLPEISGWDNCRAGTPVIYAVTSIGGDISRCSSQAFRDGDYVKGMLYNAMADAALFSLEKGMMKTLRQACREHQVGIEKRLEAPGDIPMEIQKTAWEYLGLKKRFGIDISSGFMFDPVKTCCQIFILCDDTDVFCAEHNCQVCSAKNCSLRSVGPEKKADTGRSIKINIKNGETTETLWLYPEESLMEGLLRAGYYTGAVCGGQGRCGKCKIRVLEGNAPVTTKDQTVFSPEEQKAGWRLACRLYPKQSLTVAPVMIQENGFEAVDVYKTEVSLKNEKKSVGSTEENCPQKEQSTDEAMYDIAIDIGTTTLAFEILDGRSGHSLKRMTALNSQRRYGADVIARIQASVDGKGQELRKLIREDLSKTIGIILEDCAIKESTIHNMVISCNTTMSHLLMGYDCSTLGVYPFRPVTTGFIRGTGKELTGIEKSGDVVILPGISTYVGGDIVSGLYACGFGQTEEICLLVDLGTNGEMALGNKKKILVTSTAAGPAFEGGNILWGTGSIPGAICSVKIGRSGADIRTIGGKEPVGICGTGVIETVAELVKQNLVDETGLLDERYFDNGYPLAVNEAGEQIVFTQKDIREIQLAKAAVRAGVETLLFQYGIGREQVAKVCLAGGFGYKLDIKKAIAIGMLPKEFEGKTEAVGNTSLAGAVRYLRDPRGKENLEKLVDISEEIQLMTGGKFNECYIDAMMFEEDE